ncbi:WD repeat-containing protein 43 [Trichoplax sp. H2]|nr:WD repeat-containing protein 43 [Trichoplax sp. H2]|eukprot:RDD44983.1 WD repeat-containing protein 43 [Trichoplax sp. H2]
MAEIAIDAMANGSDDYKTAFSCDGQYFASVSSSGQLAVWNSKNCKLLQTHDFLSNRITCIAWSPTCNNPNDSSKQPPRKKSKTSKKSAQNATKTYLLAGGSPTGSLAILNVNKGEVCSKMENGHHAAVTCICWSSEDVLYSASEDGLVIIWDSNTAEIKKQWKAEKSPISAMCTNSDGTKLILASRSIKVWNVETQQILTKYTGHINDVAYLKVLPSQKTSNAEYFISGAERDKYLNIWQMSTEKSSVHSPLATLALTNYSVGLDCKLLKELSIAAVCRDGQLHIYYISLNGSKRKKPVSPTSSIQIVTPADKNSTPLPVPIFNAQFCDEALEEQLLKISYGSLINPNYEDLDITKCETHCCLIRDNSKNLLLSRDKAGTVTSVQGNNSKDAKIIGPVNMKLSNVSVNKKSKTTKESAHEVTFQERLDATKTHSRINSASSLPTADSLSQMLIQAVHSQDSRLLDSVLQNNKEVIVRNTIKRIPITLIQPFLKEVIKRFESNPNRSGNLTLWLKTAFTVHSSYLITLPNLMETLGTLYTLIEGRVQTYNKLAQLEGRLEVMLTQLETQQDSTVQDQYAPLNIYEDSDTESENFSIGVSSSSEDEDQLLDQYSSTGDTEDDMGNSDEAE